jgi:hypothetical protein
MPEAGMNQSIEDTLRLSGVEPDDKPDEDAGPIYRIYTNTKIPVAKATGILWSSRIDQAKSARCDVEDAWSEAIRYYENDQTPHRKKNERGPGSGRYTRFLGNESWSETENVVFSNAVTMLPLLYAKNPAIEVTPANEANHDFANAVEKVVNALFVKKTAPGINIKSKARRGVLSAQLTNNAYLKIDWTSKETSNEAAMAELADLSTQFTKAKDQRELKEIEGKIAALEAKFDFLSPAGPKAELKSPFQIFVDPTAVEPDHSDANWMAEFTFIPTAFLRAVYAQKDGEQFKSLYEPTHILRAGENLNATEDTVANFSLFEKGESYEQKSYGYTSRRAFEAAQYTKCWYIWDKTTRRVLLYSDGDWSWPLWVWDDPLKLSRFFPYFRLWFHETPDGSQPKGEVTYYLDQQDAINNILSEVARARAWAKNNIVYDKNRMTQDDATAVLRGGDGTARGIDIPEGGKISDVFTSVVPPSISHPELFSPKSQFESIGRMTGISEAQRGAQFKTNTTNKAVDAYQQNVDIRVDEKVDAIEDWLGDFGNALAELVAARWTIEDVAKLIGADAAHGWTQVTDPHQFQTMLSLQVVGGSTEKPTSKQKKKQALEIAQVLGQFASGIPAMGLVAVKVIQRAFENEVMISPADWQTINQSMQDTAQKAGAGPGGAGGPGGEAEDPRKAQIAQMIEQLPPEAKQKLQALVQQGVPPSDALQQVMQGQQGQQPGGAGAPPQPKPH